jgi:hypothetical protein
MSALQPTIFSIDTRIEELLEYRENRLADPIAPANENELAAIDDEIERYLGALSRKVDNVAALLLQWKAQREMIAAERTRLKVLLERIEARDARLRGYLMLVLGRQPAPTKGPRRLRGNTSELVLRANGGLAPLVVAQPELVPDEFKTVELTMRYDLWLRLIRGADGELADRIRADVKQKVQPSNMLIRHELEKPCAACSGAGCAECSNTGLKTVAGAYLAERGNWIDIR